jgi:glycosyltransferase involved in cell wall biosynthesis
VQASTDTVPSPEDGKKGGIAFFRFFGADGKRFPAEVEGLSHSDRSGSYRYLAVAEGVTEARVSFVAPVGCDTAEISVGPRRVKSAVFSNPKVTRIAYPPKPDTQGRAAEPAYLHTVSIEPGVRYSLFVRTSIAVPPEPDDGKKGGLATLRFLGEDGAQYHGRVEGLSYNDVMGNYRYLPVFKHPNDTRLSFVAPPGCRAVEIRIAARRLKSAVFEDVRFERARQLTAKSGPSTKPLNPGSPGSAALAEQLVQMTEAVDEFLARAARNPRQPFLVLSSGVRKIDEAHRANRSMVMALEAARAGYNTILVYYRPNDSEPLPGPVEDGLLQLPKEFFHGLSSKIAAQVRSERRYAIFSMPDVSAASEVEVYNHFGWRTCYEARDDWDGFHDVGQAKWWALEFERYVARRAQVVTTVSAPLKGVIAGLGVDDTKIHVVPNAAGRKFLDRADEAIDRRAGNTESAKDPVVGYFGHLTPAWFDWDLLIAAAVEMPKIQFDIIGHGAPADVIVPENVKLLGPLPHEDIIEVATGWDTAIVPFKGSRLARCVDPIKTYEYVALGLKTLSYYMPQSEGLPLVSFYRDGAEFSAQLAKVLAYRPSREDYQSCKLFSKSAGWMDRLRATTEVMDGGVGQ